MRNVLLGVAVASLAGCTTQAPESTDFPEWQSFGYETMVEKINGLAGPDAINCGFVDALSGVKSAMKIARGNLAKSQMCIDQAIKSKRPFKFGLVRIAGTSYLWEVVIMTPEQEFWRVMYDHAIDGTGTQQFTKRCKRLDIDAVRADIVDTGCTDVSMEEWFSIPPVTSLEE